MNISRTLDGPPPIRHTTTNSGPNGAGAPSDLRFRDEEDFKDYDDAVESPYPSEEKLSSQEKFHLAALVLAYASLISNQTMIVGTSAVVVLSVGGSRQLAPIALAAFFSGSAFISLVTAPMFLSGGRRVGFLIGILLGVLGAGIGEVGVGSRSPWLIIGASLPLGAANGIGMHLRFAAVEVVPPFAKASAVTLVLSGGCIAAFAGPESAEGTRGVFGDEFEFVGVFLMVTIFNFLNAIFTGVVRFPEQEQQQQEGATKPSHQELASQRRKRTDTRAAASSDDVSLFPLLLRRQFFMPALIAAFSWAIMAMPMSVVRVAMTQLGFSNRLSLLTIEFHFLGMFSPGFFTGKLIGRFGAIAVSAMAVLLFVVGTVLSLISNEDTSVATWMLALIFMGIGWNFGFASATVLLPRAYQDAPSFKTRVEAANDFVMFLIAGAFIFSTGYVYEAGGSLLAGWQTVNFFVLFLIVVMAVIVGTEMYCQQRDADDEEERLKRTQTFRRKQDVENR